jgi:hypothetical protein
MGDVNEIRVSDKAVASRAYKEIIRLVDKRESCGYLEAIERRALIDMRARVDHYFEDVELIA